MRHWPGIAIGAAAIACAPLASATQTAPTPILYSPHGISSDQFESHPAFDPMTGNLLFVRSSPQFQGWRIWRSHCTSGGWAQAQPAEFGAEGVDADPFFTPDGRHLYFISSRPDPPMKTGSDLDIWRMDRNSSGRWAPPVRLPAPINSSAEEWFPRLAAEGRLYFGSSRPGGHGQTDIYSAELVAGAWRVTNLGGEVNTAGDEYEFEPARRGRFAVLMADGRLFRVERTDRGWAGRTAIATGHDGFHVGPLLSPSGRTLFFARAAPPQSGELFRLAVHGRPEAWPPACPLR
jgi:hypothetical protein